MAIITKFKKRKHIKEESYMGKPGDKVRVVPSGKNEFKKYTIIKKDGSAQVDMTFSSPSEAEKYITKKKLVLVKEGTLSHSESISNLSDQLKKYILKHKDSPNATVNDVSIAIFLSFSEVFADDGDSTTTGMTMLKKIVDKLKFLMKEYDDLIPEEGKEFDIEDKDIEDMQLDMGTDESIVNSEDEEVDLESLEDEPDDEDRELEEDLDVTVDPDYDGDVDQQKDIEDGYVA